jgi:alkylation response protein AidB-like acyl-CoA dehydrogenase
VLGASAADHLIVSARIGAGTGLFLVPRTAHGVTLRPYPLVDGTRAADVTLADVQLGRDALLGGDDDAWPAIDATIDRAITALAADAVGATRVLLDATSEYTKTRVQFGQPLAKFQALQHRMAEMAVLQEEASAVTLLATLMVDANPVERARAASAAKVKVARAAHYIGQQAIQLHGAMGVTEELSIGAYFKRVLVFEHLFGSVDEHLQRYATLARSTGFIGRGLIEQGRSISAPLSTPSCQAPASPPALEGQSI